MLSCGTVPAFSNSANSCRTSSARIWSSGEGVGSCQRVMIGRDVAAVHDELGIAVALGDVAEDLVIGAVLLDDQEHVLHAQRGEVGNAAGRLEHRAVGGAHLARAGSDLRGERGWDAL